MIIYPRVLSTATTCPQISWQWSHTHSPQRTHSWQLSNIGWQRKAHILCPVAPRRGPPYSATQMEAELEGQQDASNTEAWGDIKALMYSAGKSHVMCLHLKVQREETGFAFIAPWYMAFHGSGSTFTGLPVHRLLNTSGEATAAGLPYRLHS